MSKVAVVGLGKMGLSHHSIINAHPDVKVVAICDTAKAPKDWISTHPSTREIVSNAVITMWQRRFWEHEIRDQEDVNRHFDYIRWNPVKHGHVSRVIDWPYSTFHKYVAQSIYPPNWGGDGNDQWNPGEFAEIPEGG